MFGIVLQRASMRAGARRARDAAAPLAIEISSIVSSSTSKSKKLLSFKNSFKFFSTYANAEQYLASLAPHAVLPEGFRVGTQSLEFSPQEVPDRTAKMTMTLIALDKPTDKFAAMFTSNSFPGAPVLVGRKRIASAETIQAIVVNNKISNVCAPGGVEDSEAVCESVAKALNLPSAQNVIPSSTGIIG